MKNSIGKILFKKIFLWYLFVAILLTLFQVHNEYSAEKNRLTSSLASISEIFNSPLTHAVWHLDEYQIKYNAKSALLMDDIVGMSIIDKGTVIFQEGIIDKNEKLFSKNLYEKQQVQYQDDLIKHSLPLIYKENDSEVLATVVLYSDVNIIYNNIKDNILIIIASAMIKSFVLLILFLYFSNKLIGQPLKRLLDDMKNTYNDNYKHANACIVDFTQAIEFKTLFDGFNNMQVRIEDEVQKNKAFEVLFERSSDGLLVIENGRFIKCNQTAIEMLGIHDKEALFKLDPLEVTSNVQPDGIRSDEKAKEMIEIALKNGKHQFEWMHVKSDGHVLWMDVTLTSISMFNSEIIYVTWRDIAKRKIVESALHEQKEKLYYQAHHDSLTQLPNRMFFSERLEESIITAKRQKKELAVLFIDLDRFKPINDSLGHEVGDKVLQCIAKRLKDIIRDQDTLSRLGGDEFTILMESLERGNDAARLAEDILKSLAEPIYVDKHTLYVSSSIGISIYPQDDADAFSLLKHADAAMYKAKAEGRNNYQFYSPDITSLALERVNLEANLRQALENNEFMVYYQPQVNGETDEIIGMEALVRWKHPSMGIIVPATFIPIAEETGLIIQLDIWMMKTAVKQVMYWREKGLNPGVLALNLAMKQLQQEDFVSILRQILTETGCKPEWLSLEITESQIMTHPDSAIAVLNKISGMGVELAIDDCGTGYSSLSYLKRLPINKLKIDQSFVKDLPDGEEDAGIAKAVIALSNSLSVHVIAEGVETEEQKMFLVEHGCSNIQGYLYGKPMPANEMEEVLLLTSKVST
ncbi:EAL domain-containing protein [Campylobacterota bacterium]